MKNRFVSLVAVMAVTTGILARNGDFPQVAISPVKMNVLYLGVDNPLIIAVSGVPAEKVSATISQGTLIRLSGSEYIARPANRDEATVNVFAEIDGQKQSMGSMAFHIKTIPIPVATIAGQSGGNIEKSVLELQKCLLVDLGGDFDLRFEITQFHVSISTPEGERSMPSNSSDFTDAQMTLLSSLTKGQRVIFSNIKARGPFGVIDLRDMVFSIN